MDVAIKHISKADVESRRKVVNGETHLVPTRIQFESIFNVMRQLVEAAVQRQSVRVFRRDIKTENALVETGSDVPRVRIIDFGCGCFVKKRPYSSFSGTSAYAPSEIYRQGRHKADPATVWQLASLLYGLLDGHKQFTTSKFLCRRIRFIQELKELKVSKDCQDLLKKCLAVSPAKCATLEQMLQHPWFT
ncbi:serine/threonine-protein kinase pim-3-like [Chaetodon auriga]|uniref:serine/threonine-protein kinase pim-3-like n=1 Tax=Chaetodon auriga TaxID=39042 RepID=UPI0040330DFC